MTYSKQSAKLQLFSDTGKFFPFFSLIFFKMRLSWAIFRIEKAVCRLFCYFTSFSLSELSTTLTLENAISAEASIGVTCIGGLGVKI